MNNHFRADVISSIKTFKEHEEELSQLRIDLIHNGWRDSFLGPTNEFVELLEYHGFIVRRVYSPLTHHLLSLIVTLE